MTPYAIIHDTGMVEAGGCPSISGMAAATLQRGREMIGGFAGRDHSIVTGSTGAEHLRMIDAKRWSP